MSKFRVQEAAQALRTDAGAVWEWADVARHTADGRMATNILRVLACLPVAVKRSVLGRPMTNGPTGPCGRTCR